MGLSVEIQKKPKIEEERKICKPSEVFELKEVKEIRDAVQEHLLFLGLDTKNHIRNISIIGVGTSNKIYVDSKFIVRTALVTASDKVILVHNHPSNELTPSKEDKYISNITNKLLELYNIEFLDHIIVGENKYLSMSENKTIDRNYEDNRTDLIDKISLIEENTKLKEKIQILDKKVQKYEKVVQRDDEEYE